jgi:hypothetical protein
MIPTPAELERAAAGLRAALAEPFTGEAAVGAIAAASHPEAASTAQIARRLGWSLELLDASIRALCAPCADVEHMRAIARRPLVRRAIVGFVMPGNIPGAGLHELVLTLLGGAVATVKTASVEPLFFAHWAARLAALDRRLGARIAVFNWSRERTDLTQVMQECCDQMVAFGDDTTIAALAAPRHPEIANACRHFTDFGARLSGAVITTAASAGPTQDDVARGVALDATLFEQRGCLAPHHVFVADATGGREARAFGARLTASLQSLAATLPPPSRLPLAEAAAIRSCRERARWRALGGHDVALWEGPLPGWTVIYDRDATMTVSPGFRTIWVSPFTNLDDLARRLAPVAGRVEAFALASGRGTDRPDGAAAIRAVLEGIGATYICAPGRMQSPPLDWPHGGGAFLRMLEDQR